MSGKWFQDFKSEVMAFFEKATKKEIQLALERSKYDFYKDIDIPLVDIHDVYDNIDFIKSIKIKFVVSDKIPQIVEKVSFRRFKTADSYDYLLAA